MPCTMHSRKQARLFVDQRALGLEIVSGGALIMHGHSNLVVPHGVVSLRTLRLYVLSVRRERKHTKGEQRKEHEPERRQGTLARDRSFKPEREPARGARGSPFVMRDRVVL